MSRYRKFLKRVAAADPAIPVHTRLFRLISLTVTAICFISLPANYLQGLPPHLNLVLFLFGCLGLYLYRASRQGRDHTGVFYAVTLLVINAAWFLNAGSQGSIAFYFFAAGLIPIVYFRGWHRLLFFALIPFNGTLLIVLEHFHKDWVVVFRSPLDRYIDLVTGFLLSAVGCGVTFWTILTNLERELEARKRTEESLEQSNRALRASEKRLSLALEGGRMGMWEWKIGSGHSIWTPMEYDLLGLPSGDLETPSELFFEMVHPDDRGPLTASLNAALEQDREWQHEFRVVRPDGEVRWLMGAARLQRDAAGAPERMIGVNYDITLRKQFEEELRLAHDTLEQRVRERTVELQAANRELESFCYSVTHELGAPLRAMNCFSNILLEEHADRLDPKGADYLNRISASAGRMGHLIEDLLKLSRVTRRKLSRERVDLAALAREVVGELSAREPERTVEVVIADDITGDWDPSLIKLALQNLIGNAWKYTAKTARPRIEFGACSAAAGSCCFVRDNGIGFDMAYAEKIFLPFERLHRAGEYEGTGIGLATVQRVIAMHGGNIWAEAEPGAGATFFFTAGPGENLAT